MPDLLDQLQRRRDIWDTLDAPGQVIRNLLRGDVGAAGRHGVDFLGDVGNAAIPFADPIPSLTEREDYVDTSDLLGMDSDAPWWIKTPVNVVGNVATDPFSYVSFGGIPVARTLAKEAARAKQLGRVQGRALAAQGVDPAVVEQAARAQALPLSLEKSLSRKGRAERAAGRDPVADALPAEDGDLAQTIENVEGSDLFNQGGVRLAIPFTDIGTPYAFQGRALDPLSVAGDVGGRALDAMGETGNAIRTGLAGVREAANWRDLSTQERAMLDRSQGAGQTYGATATQEVDRILGALNPLEDAAVTQAIQNLRIVNGVPTQALAPAGAPLGARIAAVTEGMDPESAERVRVATEAIGDWGRRQLAIEREGGVLGELTDAAKQTEITNYLPRMYSGGSARVAADAAGDVDTQMLTGRPDFLKGRSLDTEQEIVDLFKADPALRMEQSARAAALARAEAGSRAMSRAALIREVVDPTAVLSDKSTLGKVNAAIQDLSQVSPDFAKALENATKGMPPRGIISGMLAFLNTKMPFAFKKSAVSGVVVPRIAALVRNQIGGVFQVGSQLGVPGAAFEATQAIPNLAKAIADGSKASWGKMLGELDANTLSKDMATMENAFKAARGDPKMVRQILAEADPLIDEAVSLGVLDNLVSAEQMMTKASGSNAFKRGAVALMDWPSEIFRYLEQNMRLGLYKKLREQKFSPEIAAQTVSDSFLSYSVTSARNRTLRDWVPFAAFLSQTLPQQARLLSRSPAAAVASSQLFTADSDAPIYPYMENVLHIPSGQDERGRNQFITGTGAPVESLNLIPGSWDEVRQNVIGQLNPVLKSALGAAFDVDPYFGGKFGQYDKAPEFLQMLGADERGDAGQAWNILKGAGLVQPAASISNVWDTWADEDLSAGEAAMQTMSGLRQVTVDDDMALRQQLERLLSGRNDIATTESIYSRTRDPESLEMLRQLQEIKARQKAARLASAAQQ